MNLTVDLDIGVDTHTGRVRTTNEDDYLVYCPEAAATRAAVGRLLVVADGMGGASGGAEASRAAIRALTASFVETTGDEPEARMTRAFAAACRRVFQLAKEQPRLRDMGTTLTAINLLGDRMVLGHVGDTRCYLVRGDEVRQLTQDHAVRRAEHQLVRCIGAGREQEEVDVATHPLDPGDILVLATDGLWDSVDADDLRRVVCELPPQAAAQELVRLAVEAGGTDNCTALIASVRACGDPAASELAPCDLPAREQVRLPRVALTLPSLRRPRWPWVALAAALAVASLAVAQLAFGFDPFGLT